jgi:hypothetical protein
MILQLACKLNSTPATAETWLLIGHTLKVKAGICSGGYGLRL